jgi:hypothetical protein
MLLAASSYSYPLLGAFWTILMVFLWVIWFWILITIFIDLFRSRDLSGWANPVVHLHLDRPADRGLGVPDRPRQQMHEHAAQDAQVQEQQFRQYVQEAAGSRARRTS